VNAVIYGRVSTDEQAERYGLASQLTELRALAAERRYAVVAELADEGVSGATLDRPALTRLRDLVRAGSVQIALLHSPDRLSRRLAHQLVLLDEFKRAGVAVEFLTSPTEDTPEGRLLLNVQGVIAEFEREKIRERTMRGKREKARRGLLPAGPIPFGYRKDPANPGRLVIYDDEARVVRLIFHYLLDAQRSLRKITEALKRAGHPAPRGGHWVASTVKRLAQSDVYAGRMWWNRLAWAGSKRRARPERDWIAIPVPEIVSSERVERARAQLRRNRAILSGRPSSRFYLLRGLLKCGACGRPWHGVPSHGRRRYRCTSRDRAYYVETCASPSRKAEEMEALVWETVTGVLRNPAVLAQKVEAHRTKLGVRDVEIQSEAGYIDRQIAALDRQERKLLALYLDDALDSPAVRAKVEEIGARRRALRDRAEVIRASVVAEAAEAAREDAVRRYCDLALKGLDALTPEGRRQLLLALVDRVVVNRDGLEIHGVLPGRTVNMEPLRVSA
jgi:site-specific DNA recombinase